MEISELQLKVDHWIQKYGVRYFNELTNTIVLFEEMGELARLMARKYGEQSFKNETSSASVDSQIRSELGDILFVIVCLANQMNIDLDKTMIDNLKNKTERDNKRHLNNPKL